MCENQLPKTLLSLFVTSIVLLIRGKKFRRNRNVNIRFINKFVFLFLIRDKIETEKLIMKSSYGHN